MTQFPPPPDGPATPQVPGYATPGVQRPPWSAAAIAGFVLSLLGCTGIGAVLGLIFGIIGIVRTHGGQRRGLGFAIAALPISLALGALSILIWVLVMLSAQGVKLMAQLPEMFAAPPAEAAETLREFCSDDFNENVSSEQLQAWFGTVTATHGRFVEMMPDTSGGMTPGVAEMSFVGKFVNGQANIKVTFSETEAAQFRVVVDDIEVDGLSPRDSEDIKMDGSSWSDPRPDSDSDSG